MIRIAIVDDHPMVLTGLQQMLAEEPDFIIKATYRGKKDFLASVLWGEIDVVLLDLNLADGDGEPIVDYLQQQAPNIVIIILTNVDLLYRAKNLLNKGCKGYLLKNCEKDELAKAIRQAVDGDQVIDPSIQKALVQEVLSRKKLNSLTLPSLTRREKEVLALLIKGYSSKDIETKLFISSRTIDNHRASILLKFDVKNTPKLINKVMELGYDPEAEDL